MERFYGQLGGCSIERDTNASVVASSSSSGSEA